MVTGLYRTRDLLLGPAVRVSDPGVDAAPIVSRLVYEILGGQPAYHALPDREGYLKDHHRIARDPLEIA